MGISLVALWLRLCTPSAGGPGFNPSSGNQIPSHMMQLKIPGTTTKTWSKQINKHQTKAKRTFSLQSAQLTKKSDLSIQNCGTPSARTPPPLQANSSTLDLSDVKPQSVLQPYSRVCPDKFKSAERPPQSSAVRISQCSISPARRLVHVPCTIALLCTHFSFPSFIDFPLHLLISASSHHVHIHRAPPVSLTLGQNRSY